ncbi:hypothetical protein KFE80_05185 [bacterium SCSIO 12696]|nr:hypothetical protein KFE80_05185 [bacterium SCSIO 12696]
MAKSRLLLIVALLLLVGGCTTKIAYNYAHWWANWAVDDYIDLDQDQKAFFKKEFRQLHRWHRQTQLPLYVDFLQRLRTELSEPEITPELIHQQALATQQLMENSKQRANTPLAELLVSLSSEQSDKLLVTLKKETQKYLKKNTFKSDKKRFKARQKSMERFTKKWLGPLSKQQKQRISSWVTDVRPMAELDANQQTLWQEKFAVALASGQQSDIKQFLDDYLLDDESLWTPEYRQHTEHNRKITRELLADLLNSRSDKQKRHLDKKLKRLIKDFQELQ